MYCYSLDLRKGRLCFPNVEVAKSTALMKIPQLLKMMMFRHLDRPHLLLLRLRPLKRKRLHRWLLVLIRRGHLLLLVQAMDLGLHHLAHMATLIVSLYKMDFSQTVIRLLRYVAS